MNQMTAKTAAGSKPVVPCPTAGSKPVVPCPTGPLVVSPRSEGGIRLSLVIPTYNESKNVGELVRLLTGLLDPVLGKAYELIVVDDDSPDRTWEHAAALIPKYPRLSVTRRQGERGLSTAVIRGWQVARGEALAVIDADLQHPPDVMVRLWQKIDGGADLAVASRHIEEGGVSDWSIFRRILSRGAQLLGLILLPGVVGQVSDPMSGYFILRRSAIAGVKLSPLGYKILIEVISRGRVRSIGEVGYVFRERTEGESKVSWKLYLEYFRHLLRLRFVSFPFERFIRFAVVGATGVGIDMAMLYLLSDPRALRLGLTRSKAIAAELAVINNFIWNDLWTFGDLVGKQREFGHKLRRLLKFNAICGLGLVFNIVILNVLFNFLHMNRYLANLIAIGTVTTWNFWLNLKLAWRDTGANGGASGGVPSGPATLSD